MRAVQHVSPGLLVNPPAQPPALIVRFRTLALRFLVSGTVVLKVYVSSCVHGGPNRDQDQDQQGLDCGSLGASFLEDGKGDF